MQHNTIFMKNRKKNSV